MKIPGKTFCVTGGASGLGEATVRMIVEEGGNVCIADMNEDKLAVCLLKHGAERLNPRFPLGRREAHGQGVTFDLACTR